VTPAPKAVWTVGHSNHEFEHLLALLQGEEIEFVVDVRSYPYSRYAPQFNRDALEAKLPLRDVGYLFLGEELGGRPTQEEHYDAEGHALYGPMSQETAFTEAVDRVIRGSGRFRLALLCSEVDHTDCHRRLLVGKVLTDHGGSCTTSCPTGASAPRRRSRFQEITLRCRCSERRSRGDEHMRAADTNAIGSPTQSRARAPRTAVVSQRTSPRRDRNDVVGGRWAPCADCKRAGSGPT
jgi:hypothetical protein